MEKDALKEYYQAVYTRFGQFLERIEQILRGEDDDFLEEVARNGEETGNNSNRGGVWEDDDGVSNAPGASSGYELNPV